MIQFIVHDNDIQLCSYCWKHKVTYKDWCCYQHYFLERSAQTHGNLYDYSKFIYTGATKTGIIICKIHGDFNQSPNTHYRGNGCQKCGRERTRLARVKGWGYFLKCSNEIHDSFYDYSKFIYTGYTNKSSIICPKHGIFKQCISSHVRGSGCPKCKGEKIQSALRLDIEDVIRRSNIVHKNKYDYSKLIYTTMSKKGIIICPKHGDFEQLIHDHLDGHGCKKCSNNHSKASILWLECITKKDSIFIQHALNKGEYKDKFKFDGYCKETNTVYEFYGDYWHGNPVVYDKDYMNKRNKKTMGFLYDQTKKRELEIVKMGYNLITIWEFDWNQI